MYTGRIRNPRSGREIEFLFKPRVYGDNDGYGRTPGEYLAYRLNVLLGMDYVPPVAYRRKFDVDFKRFDEGAIIFKVEDAHNLKDVPRNEWGSNSELFLSDTRILDTLIQNPDRHDKKIFCGANTGQMSYRPMLIDHAAAMRPGTHVQLNQAGALDKNPIEIVRKSTLDNLSKLNFEKLKQEFGEFYSDSELEQIIKSRDGIINYFEKLVSERGRDKVVIED